MCSKWHNTSDENWYMWHTPVMSFRCGIQLWQSGCVLQRKDGVPAHIKTISFFASSVILGGTSSPPGPDIEACDKKQNTDAREPHYSCAH